MHWNCARIRRRSTCCQRLLLLLLFITVLHRQRQLILAAETGWLRTDVGQLPAPDQTLTVIGYAGVRTHGWCHSVGNQIVEVTKPNRNMVIETRIVLKLPSKMPIYAGKNMRHAHFAEMCEKCGNKRNMRQSHIRIKLACLSVAITRRRQRTERRLFSFC